MVDRKIRRFSEDLVRFVTERDISVTKSPEMDPHIQTPSSSLESESDRCRNQQKWLLH